MIFKQTENGAIAYRSTLSECLDLFSVCGALRNADKAEILQKFMRAYAEDPDTAIRILFYARDVRNGLGERRFFRTILHHLADHAPNSVQKNLSRIPEYGRYDDLLELLDTQCEEELKMYIQKQLYTDIRKQATELSSPCFAKELTLRKHTFVKKIIPSITKIFLPKHCFNTETRFSDTTKNATKNICATLWKTRKK